MELPYYSKFLLIAAYLASYNPAKVDRRFFAKVTIRGLASFTSHVKTSKVCNREMLLLINILIFFCI